MMADLGPILTGLAALVIAVGGALSQMAKRDKTNRKFESRLLERYQKRDSIALPHINRLELLLYDNAIAAPPRPPELSAQFLFPDDEDPDRKAVTA